MILRKFKTTQRKILVEKFMYKVIIYVGSKYFLLQRTNE